MESQYIDDKIGKYRIVNIIGYGGMEAVYQACDEKANDGLTLKIR